jgi:hypothetical protein
VKDFGSLSTPAHVIETVAYSFQIPQGDEMSSALDKSTNTEILNQELTLTPFCDAVRTEARTHAADD